MRGMQRYLFAFASIAAAFILSDIFIQHPAQAQNASVTIQNYAFSPDKLTVALGTTVTWTNKDSVAHTSTSDSGDAVSWDSGAIPPGHSYTFTFRQAGTFTYHCSIHPFMKATIVVRAGAGPSPTPGTSSTPPSPSGTTSSTPAATSSPTSSSSLPTRPGMGPAAPTTRPLWEGYTSGHKDAYLTTAASNKSVAAALHVAYAPGLKHVSSAALHAMYLVPSRASSHQLAVFSTEPAQAQYSPLWRQIVVSWRSGVKPVLLTSARQIVDLQKKRRLTLRRTSIILDCPIVKVRA